MAQPSTERAGPPRPGSATTLTRGWRAAPADDELRRTYADGDFDASGWEPMPVPAHWRTVPAFAAHDGPLLYRTDFAAPRPAPGTRSWLRLEGVFYTSDVWLDGSYVGDTEGYFFPHVFEVTDAMAAGAEHTLAVEVACRPDADRSAKRNLTGVFQHWDLHDPGWNPGGLWRPVRLEHSGPARITHLRVLCTDATAERATVFVRAVLDVASSDDVEIVTTVTPVAEGAIGAAAAAAESVEHRRHLTAATGENQLEWAVTIPRPRRWWPHALGDQPRYDVHIAVHHGDASDPVESLSDERTRRLGLRTVAVDDWVFSVNGERLFLKGSNQGPLSLDMANVGRAECERDIALAKDANLDFLRVHAHVSCRELYDAADRAGMLLWQDMPLQWGYHRNVRQPARNQARELVDLLGHHPSIFLWCGHNEPMALDVEPDKLTQRRSQAKLFLTGLAQQVLPTWNKSVLDHAIKKVLRTTDGTRPVVAHSGVFPHPPLFDGTDTHVYCGWYHNEERDFPNLMRAWPRLARFVTEFGAQAVPEDASFLEPERWPDLDWDRAYQSFSFQKAFMDRFVPTEGYATFEEWKQATQAYQARVIRHHIETLRTLRYRPTGGFAHFHLADCQPSVTWSVLGHDRAPKLGYEALKAACAPVLITSQRLPATARPGERLELDVHVVNDRRTDLRGFVATAYLCWGTADGPDRATDAATTPTQHRWRWQGDVPADACARVGTIAATVPDAPGPLSVVLELAPADDRCAPIAANRDDAVIQAG